MNTSSPAIVVRDVGKLFQRGERHDSLRDLVPAVIRKLRGAAPVARTEPGRDEFWAVKDLTFEVEFGRALGIIGPNGAGKSTSLKLLTGILRPTTGQVRMRGRVASLIEVSAGFHQDLTGRENVYLQGAIMGMTRREVDSRLDSIVDFSGIEPFIDTPVKRYSSGMNARLGFAIAVHLEPDVLVIDEVLSVGDMAFQAKCVERMKAFKRDGVAIVFVSHNMQAVGELCDEALVIKGHPRFVGDVGDGVSTYLRLSDEPATDRMIGRGRDRHRPGPRRRRRRPGRADRAAPGAHPPGRRPVHEGDARLHVLLRRLPRHRPGVRVRRAHHQRGARPRTHRRRRRGAPGLPPRGEPDPGPVRVLVRGQRPRRGHGDRSRDSGGGAARGRVPDLRRDGGPRGRRRPCARGRSRRTPERWPSGDCLRAGSGSADAVGAGGLEVRRPRPRPRPSDCRQPPQARPYTRSWNWCSVSRGTPPP
jgi:ABC-type polysaccharide/polyol phosphate transport system ATPase subunit